jgi:hypothetical protein
MLLLALLVAGLAAAQGDQSTSSCCVMLYVAVEAQPPSTFGSR